MNFSICERPIYPQLIQRLKAGQKLLDLGCCFGADVRRFIYDGAPAENCFGSDISEIFLDLGYKLFNDADRMRGRFMVANIFKLDEDVDDHAKLNKMKGDIDILYVSSFFHLFSLAAAIDLGVIVVSLLRPVKGSVVVGRQAGTTQPGENADSAAMDGGKQYRHNVASMTDMWNEIGRRTGTSWKVEGSLDELEIGPQHRRDEDREARETDRRLLFEVYRL